ncbi:MAG TPA: Stf0 family sulfotransferase [Devosia sp.]|nr:Stf0 family sulfotransferase [Devosia sp.]
MPHAAAYVICGTPRSGSTLLCEMLATSGVAGRPHSYYRQQDIAYWADQWGVPHPTGIEDAAFDRRYLSAMLQHGSGETGVFGLRIMWGSVAEASRRLAGITDGAADIPAQFGAAFGPVAYIHLSRLDKIAQAVSLVRAKQSGLWHLAADGSVLEGAAAQQAIVYDGPRIAAVFSQLQSDDAAWEDFFQTHRIEPLRLVYETMTAAPQEALAQVLAALGRDPDIARDIAVKTARMGNASSREWAERFRAESGLAS